MEKQPKPKSVIGKKRKRKTSAGISASEPKTIKVDSPIRVNSPVTKPNKVTAPPLPNKKNKKKKLKVSISEPTPTVIETIETKPESPKPKHINVAVQKTPLPAVMFKGLSMDEIGEKYPILKNKELIDRFMKVPFNNNQKGRIRQAIKAQLQGMDDTISADILHGKIQTILKSSENLTDADLRRLRILHNMLKNSLEPEELKEKSKKKKKKNKKNKEKDDGKEKEPKKENEQLVNKVKGPKRYVVFIGNLPLDVDKEKLMKHFAEIDEHIKDVRIPPQVEGKKSAIAFIEVANELTYEMALSKHHSMLDNKRINVMYTTQQNSKITKSEAKGKAAKLVALQKSGKLAGSTALVKKRSHRRNIMKKAKAKEAAAENA